MPWKASLAARRMRVTGALSALVLGILFISAYSAVVPVLSVAATQSQSDKKDVKVWANTHSGVYHCPGTRWYGNTKQGQYMTECEALKHGYRPAYGRSCGSECKESQKTPPRTNSPPAGATALCADGTYSFSQHRRGTCSHHGGVSRWLSQ